jgi:hypothetical protein
VCYVLFDTRMDMEEAHFSPLDADLPEEMRVVNIKTIPEVRPTNTLCQLRSLCIFRVTTIT